MHSESAQRRSCGTKLPRLESKDNQISDETYQKTIQPRLDLGADFSDSF